jgi:tetratricopeptide (TPR) repeat protein
VNHHHMPTRMPRILDLYERYLDAQDSVGFVNQVSEHYTQGTLQRLTLSGLREIRRAAVLALGFIGDYESNHTLGRAMLDEDRTVRTLAENGLRLVWTRMGNERERREITIVARLNEARQFKEVIRRATKITEEAPWFAEAWHQRAIAFYALGRFADAIRDCHEALELNPYHFIAATCMGQAYLELENPVSALESFRRALRLNPDLEGVRVQVVRLARLVDER